MAQTNIKTFLCPMAFPEQSSGGTFATLNELVAPPFVTLDGGYFANPTGASLGRTTYLGVAGYMGKAYPPLEGVFDNRSPLTLGKISGADGTSNTFMIGEALGGPDTGQHGHVARTQE